MTNPAVPVIDVHALAPQLAANAVLLIDVREDEEWEDHRIDGAILMPMSEFDSADVPDAQGRPIVIMCRSGRRSEAVARKLLREGVTDVFNLEGGILAWEEASFAVISDLQDDAQAA